eukprot:GHRQ01021394.1.p1 GENE.GHRQ01021394.1~~GHRQ01021394.1.p1  ORF type:complete len:117 (-),score=19.98 GHRQ01021394.1:751-1101(-)
MDCKLFVMPTDSFCLSLVCDQPPTCWVCTQVMVVFDADMVARPNFFTKILEVMLDDDCALCLTPQGFNNVEAQCDLFNNLNLSFWEYMLPGEHQKTSPVCQVKSLVWAADALIQQR